MRIWGSSPIWRLGDHKCQRQISIVVQAVRKVTSIFSSFFCNILSRLGDSLGRNTCHTQSTVQMLRSFRNILSDTTQKNAPAASYLGTLWLSQADLLSDIHTWSCLIVSLNCIWQAVDTFVPKATECQRWCLMENFSQSHSLVLAMKNKFKMNHEPRIASHFF